MALDQDTALKVSPGPHERDKVGRVDTTRRWSFSSRSAANTAMRTCHAARKQTAAPHGYRGSRRTRILCGLPEWAEGRFR